MSSQPTSQPLAARPEAGADVVGPHTPRGARRRQGSVGARPSTVLTVVMLLCVAYFLLPLVWLVVASTKSNADLFSTFGLWFSGDFNLLGNIKDVFTSQDGVYLSWMRNSIVYSVVSAVGAAILATMAGYAFA
jgi:multiple sugar transport system permease protein